VLVGSGMGADSEVDTNKLGIDVAAGSGMDVVEDGGEDRLDEPVPVTVNVVTSCETNGGKYEANGGIWEAKGGKSEANGGRFETHGGTYGGIADEVVDKVMI
jgi:hypothetical protein